jgi:hypothetical protein
VPVLRPFERLSFFFGLPQKNDAVASREQADLTARMEDQGPLPRPFVPLPEELPYETPSREEALTDVSPERGEPSGGTEREGKLA